MAFAAFWFATFLAISVALSQGPLWRKLVAAAVGGLVAGVIAFAVERRQRHGA